MEKEKKEHTYNFSFRVFEFYYKGNYISASLSLKLGRHRDHNPLISSMIIN